MIVWPFLDKGAIKKLSGTKMVSGELEEDGPLIRPVESGEFYQEQSHFNTAPYTLCIVHLFASVTALL